MFLGFCASMGCGGVIHAQVWGPGNTNLTWTGAVSFVTTSNVTYARYTWPLACCQGIVSTGPLIRNGNLFWYDFDLMGPEICSCLSIILEHTSVTLGTLAPGVYTLITTSWGQPVATNTFRIAPVLQPGGFDTNGCFQIQVSSGVTNISYVLQCSTGLVTWTSLTTNMVSTNAIGMVLTDYSPASAGIRFYRVLCQ